MRWHFFHDWSDWADTGRHERVWFTGLAGSGTCDKVEQRRQCACGKTQRRVISRNVVEDL